MKVAIRADASARIASGHIRRCKALADQLRQRGASVRFVCREHPGHLIPLLSRAGYRVAVLPDEDVDQATDADATIAALDGFTADWLVVDHYALGEEWESRLRHHVGRILVIDDLANRRHVCDALLDQNWVGDTTARRYDDLVPNACRRLLGPRYALLDPAFAQLRRNLSSRDGIIRRLLVFFGAVDSCNQTVAVLQALQHPEFADIVVDVVVGHANPHEAEIQSMVDARAGTAAHRDLPNLSVLMATADLMLAAGGATTWERCCLAVPGLVTAVAANQVPATEALADLGVQQFIGHGFEVKAEDWAHALREAMRHPQRLRSYSAAASRITDGLGAGRVAATLDVHPSDISIRRVSADDECLLLEWANDADVRRNAFSHDPIAADAHHAWFEERLASPACLFLIGQDAWGLPIGQVRFDFRAADAVVDVSVDAAFRRRGAGVALMRAALDVLRAEGRCARVVAEVLDGNRASERMFRHCGFDAVAPERAGSSRFVLSL